MLERKKRTPETEPGAWAGTDKALTRRHVARVLLEYGDEHPNPRFEQLVEVAKRLPPRAQRIRRYIAEDALRAWKTQCESLLLREPDRFELLAGTIDKLPPLKLEEAARRQAQDDDLVGTARARDRIRVWRSIFRGVNLLKLRRALLPPSWCRDRDRAMFAASKGLLKLGKVLSENTADPGLLLLSFEGVAREFRRFLREAWSKEPLDVESYGGRADLLRELLGGSPKKLGWVRGGRPTAVWEHNTRDELREHGVDGERLEDLIDAAGLKGATPIPRKTSERQPRRRQRRRSRKPR